MQYFLKNANSSYKCTELTFEEYRMRVSKFKSVIYIITNYNNIKY